MGRISLMEYFRVPPRWLFVKITDEDGHVGWGEASLEGHTQAVEGCLDGWFDRYQGLEAECVTVDNYGRPYPPVHTLTELSFSDIEHIWQMSWRTSFYRGGPVFMSA